MTFGGAASGAEDPLTGGNATTRPGGAGDELVDWVPPGGRAGGGPDGIGGGGISGGEGSFSALGL